MIISISVISAFKFKFSYNSIEYNKMTISIHGKAIFLSENGDMNVVIDFEDVEELFLMTNDPHNYDLLEFMDVGNRTYVIYGNSVNDEAGNPQHLLTTTAYGDIIIICLENDENIDFKYNEFMDNYIKRLDEHNLVWLENFHYEKNLKSENIRQSPLKVNKLNN